MGHGGSAVTVGVRFAWPFLHEKRRAVQPLEDAVERADLGERQLELELVGRATLGLVQHGLLHALHCKQRAIF